LLFPFKVLNLDARMSSRGVVEARDIQNGMDIKDATAFLLLCRAGRNAAWQQRGGLAI